MRIISGKFKGTKLFIPLDKKTRPLKDLVKEAIFNTLRYSVKCSLKLKNTKILDLFSGTGSFGLECLSRYAEKVFFIEKEKEAIKILKKNIEKLKIKKKTKIYFDEVFKLIEKQNIFISNFNLIFCDPPFKNKNIEKLVELIFYKNLLQKDGIIILHRNKNTEEKLPNYFKIIEERIYGISKITFGKFSS